MFRTQFLAAFLTLTTACTVEPSIENIEQTNQSLLVCSALDYPGNCQGVGSCASCAMKTVCVEEYEMLIHSSDFADWAICRENCQAYDVCINKCNDQYPFEYQRHHELGACIACRACTISCAPMQSEFCVDIY